MITLSHSGTLAPSKPRFRSVTAVSRKDCSLGSLGCLIALVLLCGCSSLTNSSDTRGVEEFQGIRGHSPEASINAGRDYDPWQTFNEHTFHFNYNVLDHYALKPFAKAWNRVLPLVFTKGLANVFDNFDTPSRLVNDVLQLRMVSADRELTRFAINSTIGVCGFFDVGKSLGLESDGADMGQTLGVYGVRPGPYLVVPFMYPFTVRDAIGYGVDSVLDPIGIIAPLAASLARAAVRRINERAVHLDTYEQVEESSLDLYAAVRNAYLQRRVRSVRNAAIERDCETRMIHNAFRNFVFFEYSEEKNENQSNFNWEPAAHGCSLSIGQAPE